MTDTPLPVTQAEDLKPWGFIPGFYECRCVDCSAQFLAAKNAWRCDLHARAAKAIYDAHIRVSQPVVADIYAHADGSRECRPAVTPKFALGDRVTKTKGSRWTGHVVGFYSTSLTPDGYAVESETEVGSVQIYPGNALEPKP